MSSFAKLRARVRAGVGALILVLAHSHCTVPPTEATLEDLLFLATQTTSSSPTIVTDWVSFTPTISATTAAPTIDSLLIDTNLGFYRRVGDSVELRFEYRHRAANSANGTGTYLWALPAGLTADTTKITPASVDGNSDFGVGLVGSGVSEASTDYNLHVQLFDASNLWITLQAGVAYSIWTDATYGIWTEATVEYGFHATVPISGWTSQ